MKIITISGVDGSGKSTQIKLLTEYLRKQDARVFYFHAVEFSLARKIADLKRYCLICRMLGKCRIEGQEEKSVTRANAFQIILRKIFLRIDIWRFKNLLVKLEKQGYDYVLSDRYFYDSIVNVEFLEKNNFEVALPIQLKPNKSFYLDLSPETIMSRERKPDQGIEYLIKKQKIFNGKIRSWNMIEIDGSGSVEEVFNRIIRLI